MSIVVGSAACSKIPVQELPCVMSLGLGEVMTVTILNHTYNSICTETSEREEETESGIPRGDDIGS